MAVLPNDLLIWVILLAPGFITIITATTLTATERDIPPYYLIFSSLASSLFVDTIFLFIYEIFWGNPLSIFEGSEEFLFTPSFRFELILLLFSISVLLGIVYAIGVIYNVPRVFRSKIWSFRTVTGHSGQPWQSFMEDSGQVRVKTNDDELYTGVPVRWNSDRRERELVLMMPHRYNPNKEEYEPAGGSHLFLHGSDIQRVIKIKTRSEIISD